VSIGLPLLSQRKPTSSVIRGQATVHHEVRIDSPSVKDPFFRPRIERTTRMWDSFYSYSCHSCYSWSNHWCNMQLCVRCHCNHRAIRSCLILGLPRSGRFTLGIESQPRQCSFFSTTNSSNHTNVGFILFLFVTFVLFVVKPLVQHAAVCSLPLQPSGDSMFFDPWATVIWSLHSGNRISAKTTLLFLDHE
jgi:hypothetical protein